MKSKSGDPPYKMFMNITTKDWERLKRVRAADQRYAQGRAWARVHQKFRCQLAAEVIIEVTQMDEAAEKAHWTWEQRKELRRVASGICSLLR